MSDQSTSRLMLILRPFIDALLPYLGRLLAALVAGALPTAVWVQPSASAAAVIPLPAGSGNLHVLMSHLLRFWSNQILVALLFACAFGVFIDGRLLLDKNRAVLGTKLEEVRRSSLGLFWLFVVVTTISSIIQFRATPIFDNLITPDELSATEQHWIVGSTILAYMACLAFGWVVIGSLIFAGAPSTVRIRAAPPLMRPIFRYIIQKT